MSKKKFLLISFVGLLVMVVITWPANKLEAVFCDVGQGDAILLQSGSGQILIDTGNEDGKVMDCLARHTPFWDRKIEAVVITHSDSDHSGGLAKLKKYYSVQNIYSTNLGKNDVIKMGMISFEVLSPEQNWGNENDNSVVGLVTIGGKKMLLMADVSAEVEQKMVWRGVLRQSQDYEVVKISHHGSNTATSEELLERVRPKEVVISVGKNSFGHPDKGVIERIEKRGIRVRRTDKEGDIVYGFNSS